MSVTDQTVSAASRAVASLLRMADADLKDAELLSSGRYPGNAPPMLQLASERLLHAVLATEHGWPLARPGGDLPLIPIGNPLREAVLSLVAASRVTGSPAVSDDGRLPQPPDVQELRVAMRAARSVLKRLAATYEVDLSGVGGAGNASLSRAARQRAAPRVAPPAQPSQNDGDALARPARLVVPKSSPGPVPEPHEVAGRASIGVKQGASMASTPFWSLMDDWNIPDQAALDLIGHTGGLTKKGTRPRFKLVGEAAELVRSLQEIDAALRPLGLEPKIWLHQPIKDAPFAGATPAAFLTKRRKQGLQDTLRFILRQGLRLSTSSSRGKPG